MKNKFTLIYGIVALMVILAAVAWFALSLTSAVRDGTKEAERSFVWLSRETVDASIENGFLSGPFIDELTSLCAKSRLLSALMIETPSGAVFVWPESSRYIAIDAEGKPAVVSTDVFRKVFGASLDIGDSAAGSVRMTAVINVLQPGAIFSASRNSFMLTLAVLLVTFIVIIVGQPEPSRRRPRSDVFQDSPLPDSALSPSDTVFSVKSADSVAMETVSEPFAADIPAPIYDREAVDESGGFIAEGAPHDRERSEHIPLDAGDEKAGEAEKSANEARPTGDVRPEGLYSPYTGIGWEQYLVERLDAELVRAASSEQDLALIIVRVSGLLHTDLLSRKIASILLEVFSFRDMLFEYGNDGFAGILQNVNLDLAMKSAEKLFAQIDETLIELSSDSLIAIGITTRTARLLPAERMIQEAAIASKKAQDEPNLPIVAFRANPEKYRAFVAENGMEN